MTHTSMPTHPDTRWKRTLDSVLKFARRERPAPPDGEARVLALRLLCVALVQDLPDDVRLALETRVLRAHSPDELWHLRSQLFGAISLQFGEHVARERLQRLDAHWH